ncbi:MAG: ATP-binding protein [Acidimicrobiaceae bacterium]|nr:ATP-binding protein [Acidimicrobiaceae bacterium]
MSFTVENVRCYRDEASLSLLATRTAEKGAVRHLSVAGSKRTVAVLAVAGVFGANASGKTAILEALDDMRVVVVGSLHHRASPGSPIFRRPFLLDDKSRRRASRFEVELVIGGVRWQYGFEIDEHRVLGEYAYHYPRGRQAKVFHRDGSDIEFGPPFRSEGKTLRRLLRDNVLLLSIAGAFQAENLVDLYSWFDSALQYASSTNRTERAEITAGLVESAGKKNRILGLLRYADLGVTNIRRKPTPPEILEKFKQIFHAMDEEDDNDDVIHERRFSVPSRIALEHSTAAGGTEIPPEDESLGTRIWLALIGPVLQTLEKGGLLLVDELDASLHPQLVQRVIGFFQDKRTNPRCAQLIFNSHDTNILGDSDKRSIGRDQVWFTEKTPDGAACLYSLTDFRPRHDDAIERRYLQGRYGAVSSFNPSEVERSLVATDT